MHAPAPVKRSKNGENMLNLLSITKAGRQRSPQRRVNAGIPVAWARLYILVLLAGLTFVGCGSMPNIPPSLPGARLVPGTENCTVVVRGEEAVWWATDLVRYDPEWVKTDPQSHEVLARTRHLNVGFVTVATGFEAVWFADASPPSVFKLDAQLKSPPEKISLVSSWRARRGAEAQLAVDDHAVWATHNYLGKVFRIDPDTLTIVATIPVPGPTLVEAGEGAVWVYSRGKDLVRIDPETNRITATIPVDMLLFSIATSGGAVWGAFGPKVIRINSLTNRIEATFNVFWDSSPARYNFVAQMVVVEETLWALVFTQSKRFSWPAFFGDYALVEIDIKTNAIRTIHKLGSGEVDQMLYSPQRKFTVIDAAAWVCLPTGLYVIPIADTGHPEAGK